MLHGIERTHSAVNLVSLTVDFYHLAGSLLRCGEKGSSHYGVSSGSNSFGDISRVADASIGNYRHIQALETLV